MLDQLLMQRIEALVGETVEAYEMRSGGYTPALRISCRTAHQRFFVKVGVSELTSHWVRREVAMYQTIQGDFMPRFITWQDHETTPLMIIEDLSDAHWFPPWTQQTIEAALAQIEVMHQTVVDLPSYAEVHGADRRPWTMIAADPAPFLSLNMADQAWLDQALPILLKYEAQCSTAGSHLCHWDIRSDNMCYTDKIMLVDWNHACLSNPKLDLGFWLPSLAYESGIMPEQMLPDAPEIAAWVAGFFAAHAGLPIIPTAPRVREVQRQQLATALPWAIRALDLPPLPRIYTITAPC